LPPPPVAPQFAASAAPAVKAEPARRIDFHDYKLRNSAAPSSSQNAPSHNPQRHNFMLPDVLPQTASKEFELPPLPIIANEKQKQSKTEHTTTKSGESSKFPPAHPSKSAAAPKSTNLPKSVPNSAKLPPSNNRQQQSIASGEHDRHKRPRLDDSYEREMKYRKVEKTGTEGSHHRKKLLESNVSFGHSDGNSSTAVTTAATTTTTAAAPPLLTTSAQQASKSGTSKPSERHK
uniref:CG32790 n=1 Tax=Gongylonema pulchrum TaxID=637853 RepID=A0A183D584_9BILA